MLKGNLSKNKKYKIKQVAIITGIWVVISNLFFIDSYFFVQTYGVGEGSSEYFELSFSNLILANSLAPFLAGIIGGGAMVFTFKKNASNSYLHELINLFIIFTVVFYAVSIVGGMVFVSSDLDVAILSVEALEEISRFLFSTEGTRNYFKWMAISLVTYLFLQIDDKFGPGVLWVIITGKYQNPKEEKRIVMFLDLNNSTSIAEEMGGKKYHRIFEAVF